MTTEARALEIARALALARKYDDVARKDRFIRQAAELLALADAARVTK